MHFLSLFSQQQIHLSLPWHKPFLCFYCMIPQFYCGNSFTVYFQICEFTYESILVLAFLLPPLILLLLLYPKSPTLLPFSSLLLFYSFLFFFPSSSALSPLVSFLFLLFSLPLFAFTTLIFPASVSTIIYTSLDISFFYLSCSPINSRIVVNKSWHSQNHIPLLTSNYINLHLFPMPLVINIHLCCVLN